MRFPIQLLACAAALSFACKGEAAQVDPKSLYRFEAAAVPEVLAAGGEGRFRLAVRPTKAGAHVKAETPFRGTLAATGPLRLAKAEIAWEDRARVEGGGPIFEIPFHADAAGTGALSADLVYFVCTDTACMRTTEQVSVPVRVLPARD